MSEISAKGWYCSWCRKYFPVNLEQFFMHVITSSYPGFRASRHEVPPAGPQLEGQPGANAPPPANPGHP